MSEPAAGAGSRKPVAGKVARKYAVPSKKSSAEAAASHSSGSADEPPAAALCERCGLSASYRGDRLVYCDHGRGCRKALHEACFAHSTGVKMPSREHQEEFDAFKNYCSEHALEREHAQSAAQRMITHNLPPRKACVQAEAASDTEYYLPQHLGEASLDYNSRQESLEVKESTIAGAGKGLFATADIAKGEIVGFLYGMYRSDNWVTESKSVVTHHPCVWPASQYSEEDFSASAFTGQFRFIACEGMPTLEELGIKPKSKADTTVLVVSAQCPLGWVNSPDVTGRPAANAKLAVDRDLKADSWSKYGIKATSAIRKGEEIIFDYRWKAKDWTDMKKQRATYKEAQQFELKWLSSGYTTDEMYAWATDYPDWDQMPVHWKYKEGLAEFLGSQHANVPSKPKMQKRYDQVFPDHKGKNKRQTHTVQCAHCSMDLPDLTSFCV
jgi:hypothetical protein